MQGPIEAPRPFLRLAEGGEMPAWLQSVSSRREMGRPGGPRLSGESHLARNFCNSEVPTPDLFGRVPVLFPCLRERRSGSGKWRFSVGPFPERNLFYYLIMPWDS